MYNGGHTNLFGGGGAAPLNLGYSNKTYLENFEI
jgi:hypothetical protein